MAEGAVPVVVSDEMTYVTAVAGIVCAGLPAPVVKLMADTVAVQLAEAAARWSLTW
jgi:hypothetical protein